MPLPRKKHNKGLPTRWTKKHGAYYYRVPPGLESQWDGKTMYRLGAQLHEAYSVWSQKLGTVQDARSISQLLDRYALEVIPTKAAASQTSNQNQLPMLRQVFGALVLTGLTPQMVYQYIDKRSVKKKDPETGRVTGGRIAAHREVELLSHAFTKAVEWGYIKAHPFKNEMRLTGEGARDRYVEDWELEEVLNLPSTRKAGSVLMIQAYIRLKLLTGMSQGDLLRLKPSEHFVDTGILSQRHKTQKSSGKKVIYQWNDALRASVADALASRPNHQSEYLFCNRDGEGYINEEIGRASGWKSMWQRFMARVLKETKVKQPFTEHDLRAKVGSDAETLEHAQALLAHADSRTTKRIYRRKAEIVKPLSKPKK